MHTPPNRITRSGFIAIIGRPNAGKSTLLNMILGEKLVITSSKPQTTRNRITGVLNRGDCQLVFIDTPGVHEGEKLINKYMAGQAFSTLGEVDLVLFMVDGSQDATDDDRLIAQKLKETGSPVFLVVNKCDRKEGRAVNFAGLMQFEGIFEISALTGKNVADLLEAVTARMGEGPEYYPDDALTDRPERFIAAEYIREKVFDLTGEEIPYSVAVTVDMWEDREEKNLAVIHATIHVERDSQKAIVIGKGGALIKEIGKKAREDLEKLLGVRVFLDLHVGVEKNWTKDPKKLEQFGYSARDK